MLLKNHVITLHSYYADFELADFEIHALKINARKNGILYPPPPTLIFYWLILVHPIQNTFIFLMHWLKKTSGTRGLGETQVLFSLSYLNKSK